uniref:Potassium channel tetramerisation domain containing 10 n=1 Tax=Mus musculus TaxID=10090 RepID=S4R2A3_MOUSE
MEEMSGDSVVSSAVPAAATRTTSFKGASPSSKYVKLNVGGALYYTTMQTLTKQDTMLKAMFSGRMEVLTDSEEQRYLRALLQGTRHHILQGRTEAYSDVK